MATEPLLTCSAEDLVVLKAFAGRDKDWLDIEGVATRQGKALDERLILREIGPLLELKEDELSLPRLRAILDRAAHGAEASVPIPRRGPAVRRPWGMTKPPEASRPPGPSHGSPVARGQAAAAGGPDD